VNTVKHSPLPWLIALVVIAGGTWIIVRQQRSTNQQVLATLNDVKASLDRESQRSRELQQQVATLADRVVALERDIARLQEQVRTRSRRPVPLASAAPSPLVPAALAPYAQFAPVAHDAKPETFLVTDVLPITSPALTMLFPAGIIAPPVRVTIERRLSNPGFLKKLYVGYAALQVGDIITTTTALGRGAREGNPLIRNIAHSPVALIGVKTAAGVATVLAIEKLRQKHPVAASVTLIAMNATLAAVTINNVSVVVRQNRAKP
jgi:cell division protein FtsB